MFGKLKQLVTGICKGDDDPMTADNLLSLSESAKRMRAKEEFAQILDSGKPLARDAEMLLYAIMANNAQRLFGAAAISEPKSPEPVFANVDDGKFKLDYLEEGVCIVVDTGRTISFKLIYKQINWKNQWVLDPNDAGSRLVVERIAAQELAKDYMTNAIALVERHHVRK